MSWRVGLTGASGRAWSAGPPATLRIGISPAGTLDRKRMAPKRSRIAHPRVRRIVWMSPDMPIIWKAAAARCGLVFE